MIATGTSVGWRYGATLWGSHASLVAKADMQDSAQPGALQDSEASKFEELELQAEE